MRKLHAFAGILVMAVVTISFVQAWRKTDFFVKALPSQLQTEGFVTEGSDVGIGSALLFGREACGAVVFKLSSDTIAAVRRNGLAFFDDARQGGGYPSDPYYSYATWQRTPAPADWSTGDGTLAGPLGCAGLTLDLIRRIQTGIRTHDGYFTTKDEAELIVLPDEGIAVLAYNG